MSQNPSCRRITAAVGAVVEGIDLDAPILPETADFLRQILVEHGVIFFRRQQLDATQMEAFIAAFGTPISEPFSDVPAVTQGDMSPTKRVTSVWHSDATFVAEPPMATALRAVKLPPVGGDTCWASMFAAYDALSEPLRAMLDGLTALHSKAPVLSRLPSFYQQEAERIRQMECVHPVVCVHPQSGRKALYVNEAWTMRILELDEAESKHVLGMLFEHVKSPDFSMRWTWAPHDLALWDNRAVQHYAVPGYEGARIMQRALAAGDRPRGPRQALA